jgi:hypothetical protein
VAQEEARREAARARAERDADRAAARAERENAKAMIDAWRTGQLSADVLEANREALTPSDYVAFSKMVADPDRPDNPAVVRELEQLALIDPRGAGIAAYREHALENISNGTMARFSTIARQQLNDEDRDRRGEQRAAASRAQPLSPYQSGAKLLDSMFSTGTLTQSGQDAYRGGQARAEYDAWATRLIEEGKPPTTEQAQEQARRVSERWLSFEADTVILPNLRGGPVQTRDLAAWERDLDAREEALAADRAAKRIGDREAGEESLVLQRHRAALEARRRAASQRAKPEGSR